MRILIVSQCFRPESFLINDRSAGLHEKGHPVMVLTCPAEDPKPLVKAMLATYHKSPSERQTIGQQGQSYFGAHFEREMLLERPERWMFELGKRNQDDCNRIPL